MSDARHAAEREEYLTLALGDLSDKQRFVVECYWGLRGDRRYNVLEIADLMGVSHQAVSKTLRKAMKLLQDAAERLHNGTREGLMLPVTPVGDFDEEDGEQVCSSPFIPSHHGLPPRKGFDLLVEWDDEHNRPRLPFGFHIDTL